MGFLPLFSYRLYNKWEENPEIFNGEEGRKRAKNVFLFAVITETVIAIIESIFFRTEMFQNGSLVLFCLIIPFVLVYYITHKKQIIAFIGKKIKRRF
jgi:hypothetical protein